jgi:hypothetical protein
MCSSLLLGLSGCTEDFADRELGAASSDGDRGSWDPGKADGNASCANACGEQVEAGCWCDTQCAQYGDCCPDVTAECGFDDGGAGDDANNHNAGPVTAEALLALTQSCTRLPGTSKFRNDAGGAATVEVCKLDGAVWWRADADIDCDGGTSAQCHGDPWYQSETSAKDSHGNFIDSSTIAHIVVPGSSNGFTPSAHNIRTGWSGKGSVGAIIYDGKLIYAPYGDTGPKGVLGELSNAAAKLLGIPDSPTSGGVSSGVTYIMFTDDDNMVDPIESASKAQEVGEMLAQRLLQNNGGGGGQPQVDPQEPDPDPPTADSVCFPGADSSGNTCLPTVAPGTPSGYSYPSALGGQANYRKPVRYIDLEAVDGDTKLSPNFKLSEVAQSWKGRYAIVQPHAIEALQKMRNSAGALKINSGYRSPKYNSSVGGATHSRHMFGDGFDIDPINISVNSLEPKCTANGGKLVEYSSHVHCDWRAISVNTTFFGNAAQAAPELGFGVVPYDGMIVPDGDGYTTELVGFDEGEPVQRWTAYDADDEVIAEGEGARFVPPSGAVRVMVNVGRAIELEAEI